MTNKNAIRVLENLIRLWSGSNTAFARENIEAAKVAIKALEEVKRLDD